MESSVKSWMDSNIIRSSEGVRVRVRELATSESRRRKLVRQKEGECRRRRREWRRDGVTSRRRKRPDSRVPRPNLGWVGSRPGGGDPGARGVRGGGRTDAVIYRDISLLFSPAQTCGHTLVFLFIARNRPLHCPNLMWAFIWGEIFPAHVRTLIAGAIFGRLFFP